MRVTHYNESIKRNYDESLGMGYRVYRVGINFSLRNLMEVILKKEIVDAWKEWKENFENSEIYLDFVEDYNIVELVKEDFDFDEKIRESFNF